MVVILTAILFFTGIWGVNAQTYFYFQDSQNSVYYDYSWMALTAPSELERELEPELRKFPVESVIPAKQGVNCLRLKWKSVEGGNWFAIAAADGWNDFNISQTDTMIFWLQSIEGIDSTDLPNVFVEDITNKKSVFIPVGNWSSDLAAGVWTRITIPMDNFLTSGDGVDYTVVKTIGFAQNASDGIEHTLLVDDMRVIKGDGSFPQVGTPQGVAARAFEYHIELSWDHNPEDYLKAYEIERSLDGGDTYSVIAQVEKGTRYYIDWVKSLGETVEAYYRLKALNEASEPSVPSESVVAVTSALSDEELLDMVQEYTFRYFWDHAHPSSGMSRERNTSENTVTSGGSGFGLMAIPVGIERGYISREEGVAHILKMLNFLESADRFHGAWSHWINGNTGSAIPFSTYDNGGDIVETSYVAQGLLTIRQYFTGENADEQMIVQKATQLWEAIEWDWYRKNDSQSIYWHWSPDYEWQMNMVVRGWNEAAIVYLLAIASTTHGVPASLWNTGWATSSSYTNDNSFYGYRIYVGSDYGGPLFFAHYSFLGFDPRDKTDEYTNYFDNNRNISLIHQAYCESNPKKYKGYSSSCWGITASDDPDGYLAHEPNSTRDNGTISPTAALSSFPYTPDESMLALRHFYRELGDRIWDWMGFVDAFNEQRNWFASSYLAIDQGPILLMIENYRSQLLWNLFMANPEIQPMMDAIGFRSQPNSSTVFSGQYRFSVFPNPSSAGFRFSFELKQETTVKLEIYDLTGARITDLVDNEIIQAGMHYREMDGRHLEKGVYIARLVFDGIPAGTIRILVQ